MTVELIETKAAFARRLNLSASYISNLVKQGLPVGVDGQIPVDRAISWIRENVNAKPGRPAGATEVSDGDDLTLAKTRLVLAQAEKAELDLSVRRGELIELRSASVATRALMRTYRDGMLNFANRHGPALAAEFGVPAAGFVGSLEAKIRDALIEIGSSPAPDFATMEAMATKSTWEGIL